ncbi:MAG: uridylate kinase, partial [Betaproteobacteria bacterium]
QNREGFDDRVAHRKALRAMEQYGRMLCTARSGLVEAGNTEVIHQVLKDGKAAVWMPYEMVVADASIPQTWDVTADSLAAWLARELGAALLVLVKSVAVADPKTTCVEMMKRGWVDACFAEFCSRGEFQYRMLGQGDHRHLARLLAAHTPDTLLDEVAGI